MTLQELRDGINRELPDNDQQQITPAKLRVVLLLIVQAIADGVDA
jgi:hypothetical protein